MQQRMMEVLKRLYSCQEKTEKASLDSINQHDKVVALIGQLIMDLDCLMCKLEAMNYTVEDTIANAKAKADSTHTCENALKEFQAQLEDQNEMIINISQLLHTVMEEQIAESDAIHELESHIAHNREILDEASSLPE